MIEKYFETDILTILFLSCLKNDVLTSKFSYSYPKIDHFPFPHCLFTSNPFNEGMKKVSYLRKSHIEGKICASFFPFPLFSGLFLPGTNKNKTYLKSSEQGALIQFISGFVYLTFLSAVFLAVQEVRQQTFANFRYFESMKHLGCASMLQFFSFLCPSKRLEASRGVCFSSSSVF